MGILGRNKRNFRAAGAAGRVVCWRGPCAHARCPGRARAVRAPWRERRRGPAPSPSRPRGPRTENGGTARAAGPGHGGQRAGQRPRAAGAPREAPRGARAGGAAGEGAPGEQRLSPCVLTCFY